MGMYAILTFAQGKVANQEREPLAASGLMLSDHLKHFNHHQHCDNYFTPPSLF